MGKGYFTRCSVFVALLVFILYTGTDATTNATTSSAENSTQPLTGPITTPNPVQNTESIRDFIKRLIQQGIRDGMKTLMETILPKADKTVVEPTTSAPNQTTISSEVTTSSNDSAGVNTTTGSSVTTPSTSAKCPEGVFDQYTDTVTFTMEDRDCKITVYLSKTPKGKKPRREKKAGKDKKRGGKEETNTNEQTGERFIEKNISVGPVTGVEMDQCNEVTAQQYKRDTFSIQTSECVLFVRKPRKGGKGSKNRPPFIMTQHVGQ